MIRPNDEVWRHSAMNTRFGNRSRGRCGVAELETNTSPGEGCGGWLATGIAPAFSAYHSNPHSPFAHTRMPFAALGAICWKANVFSKDANRASAAIMSRLRTTPAEIATDKTNPAPARLLP